MVGAGVAGLGAAWFLRELGGEQVEVTVFEAAPTVGGKLALGSLAGTRVDLGAEAMLARRPEAVELTRAVGLGDDLVHPRAQAPAIWTRGVLRPLPARQVMGVPADLRALAASRVLSPAGVLRAAGDRLRTPTRHEADVAVGDYVGARMGREVVDRLVEPLLGGVYAGHASRLSLAATIPVLAGAAGDGTRLSTAARRVLARATPGPVFAGIRGGIGRLPDRIAETCGARVRTGSAVRELHRIPDGWRVVTGPAVDPAATDVDAVVLAVPAPAAARLLADPVPAAAGDLGGIDYASTAVVSLAFAPGTARAHLGGRSGFLVPAVDRRLMKAATFSSAKWDWVAAHRDAVIVRASVGRHGEERDLQHDDAELAHRVGAELAAATGLRARPIDALVTRWGGALPQYTVGHLDRVRRIRAAVDAVPGLAVCGAGYDGLGIPACIASARAAATRILDGLAVSGTMPP